MFPLAEPLILGLFLLLAAAAYWRWPGGAQISRAAGWMRGWAAEHPASAILWALVLLHGLMLAGLPDALQDAVLRAHSTNLSEMERYPISVLITSALWTELDDLPYVTLLALCVWGPVERWLGTPRTVLAFYAGHIGASVITTIRAARLVDEGVLRYDFTAIVDVGVSMGSLTLAGLLVYRLTGRRRWTLLVGLIVLVPASVVVFGRYTTTGHVLALAIGFALWPLTRGNLPEVRNRLRR
ncbi:hypothetical protein GCM10010468_33440 [Actinocorallia longicatena]|uniref:Transmembrane protein n=2 Tax=Actinocorallia longicatena TaxID=111803 RepID=A0ABP6QD17_9ACTN